MSHIRSFYRQCPPSHLDCSTWYGECDGTLSISETHVLSLIWCGSLEIECWLYAIFGMIPCSSTWYGERAGTLSISETHVLPLIWCGSLERECWLYDILG
ncbi:hypothetical protein AVEN_131811-1, partial [Araneus ventricosus]